MSDVNALVRELLRCQESYSILDKENDELRDVVVAAREWAKSCTALVVNAHVQYQVAIRLINKVNAYEANKAKRGKRKRG